MLAPILAPRISLARHAESEANAGHVLIESGFDELRVVTSTAPMDTYMSWKYQHTGNDRFLPGR